MRRAFIAGAIARVACALIDAAPSATDSVAMKELGDQFGVSPKPTTAPIHRDLLKRQTNTQILGYLAPDNTCGYVGGRVGGVKTCDTSANCAAVLGDDDFYTMGCCDSGMCSMYGACYDYASMSECDHACEQDANTVKCSETDYPYCYGYSVPGMSMGFYSCDSISTDTFDVFETTYTGEVDAQTWLALRESDVSSLLSLATTAANSETTTATGGKTIKNPTTTAPVTSKQASASTSAAPAPITQQKKSSPIGAIVGGAVGGVAVLGAIAGAILFFVLRKKKGKTAAVGGLPPQTSQYGAPNVPSNQHNPYQPPTGPGNTTSGYFAPVGSKMDSADTKYSQNGVMVTESNAPAMTPISPAPAYSVPVQQGPPPPQMLPNPTASPPPMDPRYSVQPPPMDPRFSVQQPPMGYGSPQQYAPPPPPPAFPSTQQPAAPVELGSTYAVPNQYQGRPVFEAA